MLKPECQVFRQDFDPHAEVSEANNKPTAGHRQACPSCDAWATRLAELVVPASSAALPDRLRQRLLALPETAEAAAGEPEPAGAVSEASNVSEDLKLRGLTPSRRVSADCFKTELLWKLAREHSAGEDPEPAVAEHLGTCRRCAELVETLGASIEPQRLPLPAELRARLVALVRRDRPVVPRWARDSRLAVAASLLLTLLLGGIAKDVSAHLDEASSVRVNAVRWAEQGQLRGEAALDNLGGAFGSRLQSAWASVVRGSRGVAAYGERLLELRDPERRREVLKTRALDLFLIPDSPPQAQPQQQPPADDLPASGGNNHV